MGLEILKLWMEIASISLVYLVTSFTSQGKEA